MGQAQPKRKGVMAMLPPTIIREIIDDLVARGMTHQRIAAEVGVRRHNVSQWHAGDYLPQAEILDRLAALHGGYSGREIRAALLLHRMMEQHHLTVNDLTHALYRPAA